MSNSKQAQANKEKQIVNPGPSKELWDEVLTRHGLDPEKITEYNVPEETASQTQDQKK